jgi:hypothetical protein
MNDIVKDNNAYGVYQKRLNDTINNINEFWNFIDECYIMDSVYNCQSDVAVPFEVFTMNNEQHIIFGKNGTKHDEDCFKNIILFLLENFKTLSRGVSNYIEKFLNHLPPRQETIGDKINSILKNRDSEHIKNVLTKLYNPIFHPNKMNPYNIIYGRLYDIDIPQLSKKICFFCVWESGKYVNQSLIDFIVYNIKERYNNKFTDFYFLNGKKPMIKIESDEEIQLSNNEEDVEEEKNRLAIHLMGQDEKRKFFSNFRKTRDEKNARKLGKMPMAQYNLLKYGYIDEDKRRIIRLTESQVKEIIKNELKK